MSDYNIDGTSKDNNDIDDEIILEIWKKKAREVENFAKSIPKKETVPNPSVMNEYLGMMEFLQDKFQTEPEPVGSTSDRIKSAEIQFMVDKFCLKGDDLKRFADGLKNCAKIYIVDAGEILSLEMVYKDVFIEKDKYEKYLAMKQKEKGDK